MLCDDLPASARATDHVEVVARLWGRLRANGLHELLQNHEQRQAADSAAIEGEEAKLSAGHGWRATLIRSGQDSKISVRKRFMGGKVLIQYEPN